MKKDFATYQRIKKIQTDLALLRAELNKLDKLIDQQPSNFFVQQRTQRTQRILALAEAEVQCVTALQMMEAPITGPTKTDDHNPPGLAEFLLTALATGRAAEAMVGDLNEHFADECEELGRRRAVWRYWARTLRSLWPVLRRGIGKALKWGAVIAAVRRLF
jgi:hypothetical protein